MPAVFADSPPAGSGVWCGDVTLHRGETCLLEAVSGGGKSSLLAYLYGYRDDYSGLIAFDGEDVRSLSVRRWCEVRRESLAMMFQDLRLFPELTAMENVVLKNNLTGHKTHAEIDELFARLGIADKRDVPVARMSFGQQQRVAFVRMVCQRADFFMMDEPVSHLDDTNGAVMAQLVAEEAARQGAGVVVTSIGKHPAMAYDKTLRV